MQQIAKSDIANLNKWNEEILTLGARAFGWAMKSGKTLTEIKNKLEWGNFTSWLKDNLSYDERTARRYMNIYEYRARLKTDSVSDLNSAYKLIENIRELDKVAKEYGVSSHTKAKVSKTITPKTDKEDIELHVNIAMHHKKREQRAEKRADEKQGRYTENCIKEIRRDLDSLTSKISKLKSYLKLTGVEQIVGWDVKDLLRSMKGLNVTYEGFRPFLDGAAEDERKKKQVDSIMTKFPRKELPAAIQSHK